MKNYIYSTLFILISLLFNSCSGLYILDPIDPRLPKYTETGNNVAGALINDELWRSQLSVGMYGMNYQSFIVLDTVNNLFRMILEGTLLGNKAEIAFDLPGQNIHSMEDLLSLHNRKFQLDGEINQGLLRQNYFEEFITGGVGQLYIKNVSLTDSLRSATLSGTFGFILDKTEIFYGRFDYRFLEGKNFEIH